MRLYVAQPQARGEVAISPLSSSYPSCHKSIQKYIDIPHYHLYNNNVQPESQTRKERCTMENNNIIIKLTGEPYDYKRWLIITNQSKNISFSIYFQNTYGKSYGTAFYKHVITKLRKLLNTGKLHINKEYYLTQDQAKQLFNIVLDFMAQHPKSPTTTYLKENYLLLKEVLDIPINN